MARKAKHTVKPKQAKPSTSHSARFPGERAKYRSAREKVLRSEMKLRRQIEAVAAERRKLPLGGAVEDYVFDSLTGPFICPTYLRTEKRCSYHTYATELLFAPPDRGQDGRHVDSFWPLWNLFDLTPEGRGTNWYPRLRY